MEQTGFFEEAPGQKSSNRLVFVVGSFFTMLMGAWVFAVTKDYVATISIVTSLGTVYFGGKLIQKGQENKVVTKQE